MNLRGFAIWVYCWLLSYWPTPVYILCHFGQVLCSIKSTQQIPSDCFTLIPEWISDYDHCIVWDEIANPFSNFNSPTVEFWEWIWYFIPLFIGHAITYPCWNQYMLIKGPRDRLKPSECPYILHSKYYRCWGPGDTRDQTVSSQGITIFSRNLALFSTRIAKLCNEIHVHWYNGPVKALAYISINIKYFPIRQCSIEIDLLRKVYRIHSKR